MESNGEIQVITEYILTNKEMIQSGELKRLLHGRGGSFPDCSFLNADFFPPALLVTIYDERSHLWKKSAANRFLSMHGIHSVVFQDRSQRPWISEVFGEALPENHIVIENGLRFHVSLQRGENPGIFPDMKEGRSYIRSICSGKKVLNLFSYTCAFSVAAIEGGAESVLNMDMNSNSLNRGRANHQLNHHDSDKISYLSHNILKSFGKIVKKGPFDLVIIDPPPSQGTSFQLERDYGKILRKCPDFLSPDGEVIACLNSHRYGFEWFEAFIENNFGQCTILAKMGAGEDFLEENPDRGLKIIHFTSKG